MIPTMRWLVLDLINGSTGRSILSGQNQVVKALVGYQFSYVLLSIKLILSP